MAEAAKEIAVDATQGVAPENFEMRLGSLDIPKAEFELLTDDGPFEIGVALRATDAVLAEGERFPVEITLWLAGGRLSERLRALGLAGVSFLPVGITPESGVFAGEACGGIRISVTDWGRFQPVLTGLSIAPPSAPSITFSSTVKVGTSMKC